MPLLLSGCDFLPLYSQFTGKKAYTETINKLKLLLQDDSLPDESRYGIVNQTAAIMRSAKRTNDLVLFLTNWVEEHPEDPYNAYWLLMVASSYLENDAQPIAGYYLERIIRNYPDLEVQGRSIHFICLQRLAQISTTSADRINYFNQLIAQFPNDVSITELYYRLALEYEKEGEWGQALKTFTLFLGRDDAANMQLPDIPNAYVAARQLIDFNNSSKDWTFESLDDLMAAIKRAFTTYDWRSLDKYKSKVNFFAMSWRQDEDDENSQSSFSMRSYMRGNRIHYSDELDIISTPTEAYLRTWGWNSYVNVWYLYFRKVNFPVEPDIHGHWEWAGIYFGEKL